MSERRFKEGDEVFYAVRVPCSLEDFEMGHIDLYKWEVKFIKTYTDPERHLVNHYNPGALIFENALGSNYSEAIDILIGKE